MKIVQANQIKKKKTFDEEFLCKGRRQRIQNIHIFFLLFLLIGYILVVCFGW